MAERIFEVRQFINDTQSFHDDCTVGNYGSLMRFAVSSTHPSKYGGTSVTGWMTTRTSQNLKSRKVTRLTMS